MSKQVKVGDVVRYRNRVGQYQNALVTCVHGIYHEGSPEGYHPCINLVVVSEDPRQEDSYGRQTKKETSVSYNSDWTADGGFYWEFLD